MKNPDVELFNELPEEPGPGDMPEPRYRIVQVGTRWRIVARRHGVEVPVAMGFPSEAAARDRLAWIQERWDAVLHRVAKAIQRAG